MGREKASSQSHLNEANIGVGSTFLVEKTTAREQVIPLVDVVSPAHRYPVP